MGSSLRSEIGEAVRDRLLTVTAAGGWPLPVASVFYDKIPLGLELDVHQMPAVLVMDEGASYRHEHSALNVSLAFRLHLVLAEGSTDDQVNLLIREIGKAVWANSPTAETMDGFRLLHPRVYQVEMERDETDLNMIEANRIATVQMIVHYRTRPYDL